MEGFQELDKKLIDTVGFLGLDLNDLLDDVETGWIGYQSTSDVKLGRSLMPEKSRTNHFFGYGNY